LIACSSLKEKLKGTKINLLLLLYLLFYYLKFDKCNTCAITIVAAANKLRFNCLDVPLKILHDVRAARELASAAAAAATEAPSTAQTTSQTSDCLPLVPYLVP
jgi:hypothetical protein